MSCILARLQDALDNGVQSSGVPAASVAISYRGSLYTAASGLANALTQLSATTDAVFQVGSITKTFTATLVMQLVDAGQLNLNETLRDHLPELKLSAPEKARQVTIHQLLCHTSGIDGDRLIDAGRGDDYLETFVAACEGIGFVHEPGAFFSYTNVGYIFLGRIIEKLTGQCWDAVLKERILEPLGMAHAGTLPEDLVLERFAVGHGRDAGGQYELQPLWTRSNTPSGSRLFMTASELLTFAQMHMRGGVGADGTRILSPDSVTAMQSRAVGIPLSVRYKAWGLGWSHSDWGGQLCFGHDGGVAGTASFLRILPRRDLAIALMTNGAGYHRLQREVMGEVLRKLGGIESFPTLPEPAKTPPVDLSLYAGFYTRFGLTLKVTFENGRLLGQPGGEYGDPDSTAFEIECIDRQSFRARLPEIPIDVGIYFLNFDESGRPQYVHYLERAFKRAEA